MWQWSIGWWIEYLMGSIFSTQQEGTQFIILHWRRITYLLSVSQTNTKMTLCLSTKTTSFAGLKKLAVFGRRRAHQILAYVIYATFLFVSAFRTGSDAKTKVRRLEILIKHIALIILNVSGFILVWSSINMGSFLSEHVYIHEYVLKLFLERQSQGLQLNCL